MDRVRSVALPLVLVAVILYIDSLTHPAPVLQIVVGLIVLGLVVFGSRLLDLTGLRQQAERIPERIRPILLALPPAVWFAVREEGTSGSGTAVAVVSLGLVAVISFLGPEIDRRLAGFYARRDRILPRPARVVLAFAVPLFVALAVIHGSLAALPVLFRGTTSFSASAAGRTGLIVVGTLVSGIAAYLLLRGRDS